MIKPAKLLSLVFLSLAGIFLVALQMKPVGLTLLVLGAIPTILWTQKAFKKDILLLYLSFAIIGIAPISTSLEDANAVPMGLGLILAIILPYLISHYVYKDGSVQFSFHHGRNWYKREIFYIFFTMAAVYVALPYLLRITGSYENWVVHSDPSYLIKFFVGINLVGVFDELFFISTVLGILRKHLPFYAANAMQSVLFTSFLYELGFQGLLVPFVFLFAFVQGNIFYKTQSLFYLISIHLAADLVLYLALVHAYFPHLMPIFLIK